MKTLDAFKLQRLIDGQISFPEMREILLLAESQPGLWRSIATTYMENQLWRNEFRTAETCPDSSARVHATHATSSEIAESRAATKSRRSGDHRSGDYRSGELRRNQWLALAGCMLLALGIGFAGGLMRNWGIPKLTDGTSGLAVNSPDRLAMPSAASYPPSIRDSFDSVAGAQGGVNRAFRPAYHLQLENADGQQFMDSDIPLYEATDLRALDILEPTPISLESQARWRQSGFRLDQATRYISGRLNDGREFIVPIQQIRLSPGQ